jgi:ribosome biogenesis GTPase
MNLEAYGWNEELRKAWDGLDTDGLAPARVVADFGTSLRIAAPELHAAELSGKIAHYADRADIPKVGDWVGARLSDNGAAVIEVLVPRRSEIARKVAGKRTVKQIIAANVDIAFVLLALDNDFSIERLKRFLYQLSVNNIRSVVVLNKADKTDDVDAYKDQLRDLDLPLVVATATTGSGVDEILAHITPGQTAILLGSSGVGKSTLTNRLLGREAQTTQAVREADDTGKHTTVHRELFVLPGGGLLIDTPGVRELQLWGTEEKLVENFEAIAEAASHCQYANCSHRTGETGCAVQAGLRNGTLDAKLYANYIAMQQELATLKAKRDVRAQQSNRRSTKSLRRRDEDSWNDE